jgi:excisionase family DNA binding protein
MALRNVRMPAEIAPEPELGFNGHTGKRLLNPKEAAEYLGLQVDTVYKKSRLRELPSVKVGRALRYDVVALNRYVEQHTIKNLESKEIAVDVYSQDTHGLWKVRWREGGRNRSTSVHGSHELAKEIERKKMSVRDENGHLDVKREGNLRMSTLIDRYSEEYGRKKKSTDRETSILERIRMELGNHFVREVDGSAIQGWYGGLTEDGLSAGTAVRHFNIMHHVMEKACTIWSKETALTGIRRIRSK